MIIMNVLSYEYTGLGMSRVFETEEWTVGIKNWKPASDRSGIDCLERHNLTDELFVLLEGKCDLLFANEENGELVFDKQPMEFGKVYNIPATLWHNAVMEKGTKMVLIENASTSPENSDVVTLSAEQIQKVQTILG